MNLKSILLGTAAAVVAAPAAYAADIAQPIVPVAVDYVKVCDTFSTGFFYIPGTDTCLRVAGRVRFRTSIGEGFGDDGGNDFGVQLRADARIDFDARTMTEYGQLRSFFRIATTDGNGLIVDDAFLQLGYFTAGYATSQINTSVLYGINDQTFYDFKTVTAAVIVDDLGGGFFVGASVQAHADRGGDTRVEFDGDALPAFLVRAGIADQPWGGVEFEAGYIADETLASDTDMWFVRGLATIKATSNFEVLLSAAYVDSEGFNDEGWYVGLGGYFNASSALGIYAGVVYDDGAFRNVYTDPGFGDERLFVNAGVDYTVTPGLVLTGELNYEDSSVNDDAFAGFLQLSRTF
jgi:hypothetical protein